MDLKETNSPGTYELFGVEGLCQLSQFSGCGNGKKVWTIIFYC